MATRILIVDDDPDLVAALKVAIETVGYEVDSAGNSAEALQTAGAAKPDLAILDVMMDTGSEGVHLAHRFRTDEGLKEVPIIMLTAVNQTIPFQIGKEMGEGYLPVDCFMEKPVDPLELIAVIRRLLQA